MAAPTAASLVTIVAEGLSKAGYPSPSSTLTTRAQDYWMREIKNDIWNKIKNLKMLQVTSTMVTVNGQSKYSNPTDYSKGMTMQIMDGSHYDTATAGAAGSITLAATEDVIATDVIGKEIFIYSGTGSEQLRQITAYNATTKVATITPNWTVNPVSGSKYMIIDTYFPVTQKPINEYDTITNQTIQGMSTHYFPTGDADYGEFLLWPMPYRSTAIPYGLKMRYYANLMTIDLASTTMTTVYGRWETVFIQGIFVRALQIDDKSNANAEMKKYNFMINMLAASETYGNDMSNLTCKVGDC